MAQDNTHQTSAAPANLTAALTFGDTDKSRFSLHHTLAARNAADLGTADADVPANSWKAAAFNHTHDFNGPSILNKPYLLCTSTTRPTGVPYGTMIYETDSNVVRVWAKINRQGLVSPNSEGMPYWQILPVANVPLFQAESRMEQELIPVYPNAFKLTHVLSDFIWSATGIQRFMAVTTNQTFPTTSWTYIVRSSNNGNYRLTYNGITTPNISWNANASTIQSILATALSLSTSDIEVTEDTTGPFFTVYTKTVKVYFSGSAPSSTLTGTDINLSGSIDTALLGPYPISPQTAYYGQYPEWKTPPDGGLAINIPEPGVYEVKATIHWAPDRTYHDQSMIAILVNDIDIGKKNWEFTRGPTLPWGVQSLPGFSQTNKLAFSWRFAAGDTLRVVVRHNGYRSSFLWYNSGSIDRNAKQICDVEVQFKAP